MKINRFKYLGLAFAVMMLDASTALAASSTGKITEYHLNGSSAYQTRGVCIRMNPVLPTNGGWACLYKNNYLYREITDLFLEAYKEQKTCQVNWSSGDSSGHGIIDWVSCY
jgi:hypothetical protein